MHDAEHKEHVAQKTHKHALHEKYAAMLSEYDDKFMQDIKNKLGEVKDSKTRGFSAGHFAINKTHHSEKGNGVC